MIMHSPTSLSPNPFLESAVMAHTPSLENAMPTLDQLAKSVGAWYLAEPTSDLAATSAPSSMKGCDTSVECDPTVIEMLVAGIRKVFEEHSHAQESWTKFLYGLVYSVQSLCLQLPSALNEATMRSCMLTPLLNLIVEKITLIPDKKEEPRFHAYLISELPIQLHSGSGRRALVDYALILSDSSVPFTVIPMEIDERH